MVIFEEISRFIASKSGIVRKFYPISQNTHKPSTGEYNKKNILNFCSNDYLRLSKSQSLIESGIAEMQKSGTGSGGTRNISGTNPLHNELEEKLADFHKKESAVLFNSAYNANVGALFSLGRYLGDVAFFSDEQNHASIIHGINLSKAKKIIYSHNNFEDLDSKLSQNSSKNKIIVCESIYSMSGNRTNISKLVEVAKKHECLIYLDEVHAIGIYGNGKGIAFEDGLSDEIHIINGTLGKAVGCVGGYISTTNAIAQFIKLNATTFIFSTSLPPFVCASVLKSLEIIESQENLRTQLFANVKFIKEALKEKNIHILQNSSHIIILPINCLEKVKSISKNLLELHNIYIQPIFYPTVPFGKELLRITPCPQNTKEELELLVEKLNHELEFHGMKKSITVVARKSVLSRTQAETFILHAKEKYPQYSITESYISTFGDSHTKKPIHELEFTNAFTKEIEQVILQNSNTIGISSLKDIEIITKNGIEVECFLERANPRDVMILNKNAKEKISRGGNVLKIGTSSIRRKHLFEELYAKILPNGIRVEIVSTRGNIDTRIERLELSDGDENYLDGVILAAAGLIRLKNSILFKEKYFELTKEKTFIMLPISQFPTPPGQGVIACQTLEGFSEFFKNVNHLPTAEIVKKEKKLFHENGTGCRQGFGVTHVSFKNHECSFIKGITDDGRILNFVKQEGVDLTKEEILQMCDSRKFNLYQRTPIPFLIPHDAKNFFIATKHAVTKSTIAHLQNANEVWASGFKTHEFLSKNGILCNGSVESLGFDELQNIRLPLNFEPFYTLTYKSDETQSDPFTIATYSMQLETNSSDYKQFCDEISKATVILWTSLQLYKDFSHITKQNAKHVCMLGKTYDYISQKEKKENIVGIFNFEALEQHIKSVL
jgi:hydroxymethylbilane synthase